MAQFPNAVFTDSIGSSETGFQGTGLQDASTLSTDGPVVSIGANTAVISDEGHVLDPVADVGKVGRTARAATSRSATTRTRRSRRGRSTRSTAFATPSPATSPGWRRATG